MRCLFSLGIPYLYGELFFAFLEQQEDLLSINEYNYIKSTISKKSVPTVQALIKDHKKKDENGDYPSRLVVPAKNLTAGFPHVGQHGLRNILDKNMVDYERKTTRLGEIEYQKIKLNHCYSRYRSDVPFNPVHPRPKSSRILPPRRTTGGQDKSRSMP
jgi:hypothetical protein